MKISSLAALLANALSAPEFTAEIAEELAVHLKGLEQRGGVAPVEVTEDADLVLDRAGLRVLCRLFADGQLTAHELAYTSDVLQFSDRVEYSGPNIADDLFQCTDPEINGPMTVERALEIAAR